MNVYFLVSIPHPKGGNIIWTCVKYNITKEKDQCKAIGLRGFDYKLFEGEEGGGVQEGLYGYPYLKHLIQLCPGDWANNMKNMNKSFGMKNCLDISGRKKQLCCTFISQCLWKYVGCVLLAVTYGKKGKNIWRKTKKYFGKKERTKLHRYVRGNTYLFDQRELLIGPIVSLSLTGSGLICY